MLLSIHISTSTSFGPDHLVTPDPTDGIMLLIQYLLNVKVHHDPLLRYQAVVQVRT